LASLIDPLNVDLDDNSYIDTKSLCIQIGNELKQHSIPQAVFAEKILCRSQGTLSDLLRNPKPWEKLKSGRETFRRMYNWMNHPLNLRLAILDMKENSGNFWSMLSIHNYWLV
jgi:nuclear factor 6 (one cut domain family protein 1)